MITQTKIQEITTKKELNALNLTNDEVRDLTFAECYKNYVNYHAISIEYSIEDSLLFAILKTGEKPKYYKRKIYYGNNDYIVFKGERIYMEEFFRKY